MVDDFGNKDAIELALDQAVGEAVSEKSQESGGFKSSMLIETPVQVSMWAADPVAPFDLINKDLPMANLEKPEDLLSVRTFLMFAKRARDLKCPNDSEFFEFMAYLICDSSLAIKGFAHRRINVQGREIEFKGQLPPGSKPQGGKMPDFKKYMPKF